MKIELPAPAKVNLTLHVTGRREDGYHELVTRMQKLDCCDWLELELTDTGQIEIFQALVIDQMVKVGGAAVILHHMVVFAPETG